jgi:formamidopyrimidine-DNA glycosylase
MQKEATTETTTIENSDNTAEGQLYACPMHPEVTGKQGEECSKCGMELRSQLLIKRLRKQWKWKL